MLGLLVTATECEVVAVDGIANGPKTTGVPPLDETERLMLSKLLRLFV